MGASSPNQRADYGIAGIMFFNTMAATTIPTLTLRIIYEVELVGKPLSDRARFARARLRSRRLRIPLRDPGS